MNQRLFLTSLAAFLIYTLVSTTTGFPATNLCDYNSECSTSYCSHGVCCSSGQCGYYSGIGFNGVCYNAGMQNSAGQVCASGGAWKTANYYLCTASSQCNSADCSGGVCCQTGQCGYYSGIGSIGECYPTGKQNNDGQVCTSSGAWKTANLYRCTASSQCDSGVCNGGVCCQTGQCGYDTGLGRAGFCYDTGHSRTGNYYCYYGNWYYGIPVLQASLQNDNGQTKTQFQCGCAASRDSIDLKACIQFPTPPPIPTVDPLIYVVPDGTYGIGSTIPADVSGNVEKTAIPTDCNHPLTIKIWDPTTCISGNYRVIVDFDEDGIVDKGEVSDSLRFSLGAVACPTTTSTTTTSTSTTTRPPTTTTCPTTTTTSTTTTSSTTTTTTRPPTTTTCPTTTTSTTTSSTTTTTARPTTTTCPPTTTTMPATTSTTSTMPTTTTTSSTTTSTNPGCGNLKVFKYNDHNGNGVWETGEEGVGGVQFTVQGPQSFTLTTGQYGEAFKYCIPLGTYTITENVPAGWASTNQNPQTVTLDCELLKEAKFGDKQVPASTTSSTSTTTTTTRPSTTSTTSTTTTTAPCVSGLRIRAKGESSAGVAPIMQLWIDGKLKAQWNVLDSVRDYSYDADLGTSGHNIDVVYTNNCETATTDRNLFVYQIQAGCTTMQSTDSGVIYDKGVGNAAFDGIDTVPGQAEMYWSGALRFKLNGGYTGTTTTTTHPSTTTTTSVTTTTGPCQMVGDYPKCGEVTITEVLGLITKWANGQASIQQVLTLITAWSRGA